MVPPIPAPPLDVVEVPPPAGLVAVPVSVELVGLVELVTVVVVVELLVELVLVLEDELVLVLVLELEQLRAARALSVLAPWPRFLVRVELTVDGRAATWSGTTGRPHAHWHTARN